MTAAGGGGVQGNQEWVTFGQVDGAELVRLVGEIDLANAAELGREIAARTRSARAVLVDLSTVSFLDSAGVRLLDELVGELDERDTPIRFVVGGSGAVRMALRLCAFREELLTDDVATAANAVRG